MAKLLQCTVVTPEQKALDQAADFVALPLYDGEIGIGVDHSPLIGRLGYGEMRLRQGDKTSRYYLDGGFVQVLSNQVTVLTSAGDRRPTRSTRRRRNSSWSRLGSSLRSRRNSCRSAIGPSPKPAASCA